MFAVGLTITEILYNCYSNTNKDSVNIYLKWLYLKIHPTISFPVISIIYFYAHFIPFCAISCRVAFWICYFCFCYWVVTSFAFHWSPVTPPWIFLLFIPLERDKYKFVLLKNRKQSGSMVSGKGNLCCRRRRKVEFTLLPVYQGRYKASSV